MYNTFYKKLPDGIRIVHRETASPVAYLGVMVGTGTRDETPDISGMAHYIEHCVFKGCLCPAGNNGGRSLKPLTGRQIINRVEGVGGEINAYTTKEETTFYAAAPLTHYSATLKMLLSMVTKPTFPKKETDKELTVILDEIETYKDSPGELIYDDFENMLFQGHSLEMPVLGTPKTLKRFNAQKALDFLHAHYTPDTMVVFSQGNLPFERVVRNVEKTMEALRHDDYTVSAERVPFVVPPDAVTSRSFHRHTHQVHVMLGGHAYPLKDNRQHAAYVLNYILGGGALNTRLNMTLREQYGLVYTVESQYTPMSDTGYWSVYFATDAQNKQQCLDLVYRQLRLLCEKELTQAQMSKVFEQLHGQMAIAAENQENSVLAMAKNMLYFDKAPTWLETFEKLKSVTAADILRTANDLYASQPIYILSYD